MNILFFCRLFYPHIGGVETHVEKISLELIKKGHSVVVITEQFDLRLPRKQTYRGIEIYRIPVSLEKSAKGRSSFGRKKFEIWNWLWKHDFLLHDADIIHAHDVSFWFFPFKAIYPFKKFFTTFHGYETKFPPQKSAIAIRKASQMLSRATIAIGDYIEKWYGTKADVVIYGGTERFKIQDSRFKKTEKIKILFIGRVEQDNGVLVYAKALELLKKKKLLFEFKVIGDGSKRKLFEKYGKVLSFVHPVEKYISDSDIVFASSYLSIMQTLSLKKKVIAVYTNQLKKDYLLLSPFSKIIYIEKNAQGVVERIQEPFDTKKAEKGYSLAKTMSWKKVALQYEQLWQK